MPISYPIRDSVESPPWWTHLRPRYAVHLRIRLLIRTGLSDAEAEYCIQQEAPAQTASEGTAHPEPVDTDNAGQTDSVLAEPGSDIPVQVDI